MKEIFFHFSELPDSHTCIVGQEVEYSVQTCRSGKETATGLQFLPVGSVVFDDLSEEYLSGIVLRNHEHSIRGSSIVNRSDYLNGRVSVTYTSGVCVQLPFGFRDQRAAYTLQPGDVVRFRVATDRRDQLQRATEINLQVEETMSTTKEAREKGLIVSTRSKERYGFIMSPSRKGQLFFHFSELFDQEHSPAVSDKVEFTPVADSSNGNHCKEMAIRIRLLPSDAADFSLRHTKVQLGVIQQEAAVNSSPTEEEKRQLDNAVTDNIGIILFQVRFICSHDLTLLSLQLSNAYLYLYFVHFSLAILVIWVCLKRK